MSELLPIVRLPVIPTTSTVPQNQHYTFIIPLDRIQYVFDFYWLPDSGWYFDIRQPNRTLLITGQPLACGVDLLWAHKHDIRLPQGVLYVRDVYNSGVDPMADDAFSAGGYVLLYQSPPSGDAETPVRLTIPEST